MGAAGAVAGGLHADHHSLPPHLHPGCRGSRLRVSSKLQRHVILSHCHLVWPLSPSRIPVYLSVLLHYGYITVM